MSTLNSKRSTRHAIAERLYRHGLATLGVQSFMLDASTRILNQVSRRLGLDVSPPSPPFEAIHVSTTPAESTAEGCAQAEQTDPTPPTPRVLEEVTSDTVEASLVGAVSPDSSSHVHRVLTTESALREAILELREAIAHLDDVQAFDTIRAIDNDMYHLWKELERKMQRHRQSEAKAQLKGMFNL